MKFDVARWLEGIGLAQYARLFEEQGFDEEGLSTLTDAELQQLGITAMGHRKTLLREAQRLQPAKAAEPVAPPPPPIPRGRVFLSYGHDEACSALVQRLKSDLEQRGWDAWFDAEHIQPNDEWRQAITKGLKDSQHVLALLSRHSMRKDGVCRQEVAIAMGPFRCSVFTVLVEPPAEVKPPLIISHRQWLDMQKWFELGRTDPAAQEALYQWGVGEILRVLESNQPFAGEIQELQRWLDPLDCTADMVAAEKDFHGRRWLLGDVGEQREGGEAGDNDEPTGEIEHWRTAGTPNQVFWLAAEPGWGKSAVAARLAHAGRARVLAVHFCKHDRPGTRDAGKVVRTLAFQMASQMGEYRELLLARHKEGLALQELNPAELFQELLANPLAAHVIEGGRGPHDRHLVVLDALDETLDGHGRSELLDLVANEFGKLPKWLGLVVTSRPEAPVMLKLQAFGVQRLDAADPRNLQDLQTFAANWLQKVALPPAQREQALPAVCEASAGNFLYLRKLQEAVEGGVIAPAQLTRADTLPKGLGQLYLKWFERRFPDPDRYDEKVRPLLELMLAAREPLPVDMAAALLNWGAYGARVLDTLGTLCVNEGGRLNFFHKSLRDWLGDVEVCGSTYWAKEAEGHSRMADAMLRAFEAWRATETPAPARDAWKALGEQGDGYAMRHMPAHLAASGRREERRAVLTDFALAMRRCEEEAVTELVGDYRQEALHPDGSDLSLWAIAITERAHLLLPRESTWPARNILFQVATEHSSDGPLSMAARAWHQRRVQQGGCGSDPHGVVLSRLGPLKRMRVAADDSEVATTSPAFQLEAQVVYELDSSKRFPPILWHSLGLLVTIGPDGAIHIVDPTSGGPSKQIPGSGAAELPGGALLTFGDDGSLLRWNPRTGQSLGALAPPMPDGLMPSSDKLVGAQMIGPDELAVWSQNGLLAVVDATNGAPKYPLVSGVGAYPQIYRLPDDTIAVRCGYELRVFALNSGQMLYSAELSTDCEVSRTACGGLVFGEQRPYFGKYTGLGLHGNPTWPVAVYLTVGRARPAAIGLSDDDLKFSILSFGRIIYYPRDPLLILQENFQLANQYTIFDPDKGKVGTVPGGLSSNFVTDDEGRLWLYGYNRNGFDGGLLKVFDLDKLECVLELNTGFDISHVTPIDPEMFIVEGSAGQSEIWSFKARKKLWVIEEVGAESLAHAHLAHGHLLRLSHGSVRIWPISKNRSSYFISESGRIYSKEFESPRCLERRFVVFARQESKGLSIVDLHADPVVLDLEHSDNIDAKNVIAVDDFTLAGVSHGYRALEWNTQSGKVVAANFLWRGDILVESHLYRDDSTVRRFGRRLKSFSLSTLDDPQRTQELNIIDWRLHHWRFSVPGWWILPPHPYRQVVIRKPRYGQDGELLNNGSINWGTCGDYLCFLDNGCLHVISINDNQSRLVECEDLDLRSLLASSWLFSSIDLRGIDAALIECGGLVAILDARAGRLHRVGQLPSGIKTHVLSVDRKRVYLLTDTGQFFVLELERSRLYQTSEPGPDWYHLVCLEDDSILLRYRDKVVFNHSLSERWIEAPELKSIESAVYRDLGRDDLVAVMGNHRLRIPPGSLGFHARGSVCVQACDSEIILRDFRVDRVAKWRGSESCEILGLHPDGAICVRSGGEIFFVKPGQI